MSVVLHATAEEWDLDVPGSGVRVRKWTVAEFLAAAEMELFDPTERLELIGGDIIERMTAQDAPHFLCIRLAAQAAERAFGPGHDVRQQGPFKVSDEDYVEPDVLVVAGSSLDYADRVPMAAEAKLVIEVADTTLRLDRGRKAVTYARGGVADYWILNVNERCLEVHREPVPQSDASSKATYRSVVRYTETESLSALAAPQSEITVAELLPPSKSDGSTSQR